MNGEAMTGRSAWPVRRGWPSRTRRIRIGRPPRRATSCRETRGEARPFPRAVRPRHSRRPLTDEQRELVDAVHAAGAGAGPPVEGQLATPSDELEAEAYAALVEAAQDVRPGPGRELRRPCPAPDLGALRDYRRFLFQANWKGERGESPVFERLSADRRPPRPGASARSPTTVRQGHFEATEAVASIIRLLPRSQAVACRLMYLEGKSSRKRPRSSGCSKGYVSRLHSDAMVQLRRDHREALAGMTRGGAGPEGSGRGSRSEPILRHRLAARRLAPVGSEARGVRPPFRPRPGSGPGRRGTGGSSRRRSAAAPRSARDRSAGPGSRGRPLPRRGSRRAGGPGRRSRAAGGAGSGSRSRCRSGGPSGTSRSGSRTAAGTRMTYWL